MKQISVIIPLYNAEKYLDNCIQSILGQTYQEFEIVLVDDGSTDNSRIMVDCYAEKYQHVKVVHTENRGPAAARKEGIELAAGEYVMFVDADDWLDRRTLEYAMSRVEDRRADIVCFGHRERGENGQTKAVFVQDFDDLDMPEVKQRMVHLHGTRLIDSGPWAKLIRKTLFENIDFCENVTIGEDYFMVLQLLEKAESVVLCKEPMYNRCIRTTSISRSGYSERHRQAFEEYMKWRNYLLEKYPELGTEIIGYHTEYEMAVITAMCRNQEYDKAVIRRLVKDLRKNRRFILHCAKTPFYMKVSAVVIAYCYPMFIVIFRGVHLLTGR